MNRRQFLKGLFASAISSALDTIIEELLEDTAQLSDTDFMTYVTINMNLYVSNPSKNFVITNIEP